MKSKTSLAAASLLALAGCGGTQEPVRPLPIAAEPMAATPGVSYASPHQDTPLPGDPSAGVAGPRGSSQQAAGEHRYDEVGYAGIRSVAGGGDRDQAIVAIHPSLPENSYVEVTSLDTGRTILVLVTGRGAGDDVIDLSPGAAHQLGYDRPGAIPVRVRAVMPPPQDQVALRSGRSAAPRVDAPQVLLTALRHRLPATIAPAIRTVAIPPSQPRPAAPPKQVATSRPASAPVRPTAAPVAANGRYLVQIAALSSAPRAQALAQSMQGFVKAGGGLYRVQMGPFATASEAQAARARAARAGYGDARIIPVR